MTRTEQIIACLTSIDGIRIVTPLEATDIVIKGSIDVAVENTVLQFDLEIFSPYPFQFKDQESIRFLNKKFTIYNHVNEDGSICLHTQHSPDLTRKLIYDIDSLRQWIKRYYISKAEDAHYEHIIVPDNAPPQTKETFLFTDVDYQFKKNEFGVFTYSIISNYENNDEKDGTNTFIVTNIVKEFKVNDQKVSRCQWSKYYTVSRSDHHEGIFIFVESAPVINRRFAMKSWRDLKDLLPQNFLEFITRIRLEFHKKKSKRRYIPLLVGYNIDNHAMHWQAIVISINEFPVLVDRIPHTRVYNFSLNEQPLHWYKTINSSYRRFFGRGKFHERLIGGRVAILGLGAIGSQIATTLARGGLKELLIVDYDLKEPENVCRSEYLFSNGIIKKNRELTMSLVGISPFINVYPDEYLINAAKFHRADGDWRETLQEWLTPFDIIFDCTTDNDIAYMLDKLQINADVFSFGVTNHAKELVCAVSPRLYEATNTIYSQLDNDVDDLYNPTGCWSPTFKASYNDIAVLVQYAIKQINSNYVKGRPQRSFYLATSEDEGFQIKLKQL